MAIQAANLFGNPVPTVCRVRASLKANRLADGTWKDGKTSCDGTTALTVSVKFSFPHEDSPGTNISHFSSSCGSGNARIVSHDSFVELFSAFAPGRVSTGGFDARRGTTSSHSTNNQGCNDRQEKEVTAIRQGPRSPECWTSEWLASNRKLAARIQEAKYPAPHPAPCLGFR